MELHERGKLKGLSRKIVVVLTAAACTIMLISVTHSALISYLRGENTYERKCSSTLNGRSWCGVV